MQALQLNFLRTDFATVVEAAHYKSLMYPNMFALHLYALQHCYQRKETGCQRGKRWVQNISSVSFTQSNKRLRPQGNEKLQSSYLKGCMELYISWDWETGRPPLRPSWAWACKDVWREMGICWAAAAYGRNWDDWEVQEQPKALPGYYKAISFLNKVMCHDSDLHCSFAQPLLQQRSTPAGKEAAQAPERRMFQEAPDGYIRGLHTQIRPFINTNNPSLHLPALLSWGGWLSSTLSTPYLLSLMKSAINIDWL